MTARILLILGKTRDIDRAYGHYSNNAMERAGRPRFEGDEP
jgi:hypothetical protein